MKIRVMVVEDEPLIQRSVCQKIEEVNGHFQVVATADNGKEAYKYLQKNMVDVLFVDMNLLKPLKENELKLLLEKIEKRLRRQQFEENAQKLEEALTDGRMTEDGGKTAVKGQEYCMLLLTFGNSYGSFGECGWNY